MSEQFSCDCEPMHSDATTHWINRVFVLETQLAEARVKIEYGKKVQQGYIKACEERDKYKRLCETLRKGLRVINTIGLDRSLGQIVGSEHYEKAWLDCVERAGMLIDFYDAEMKK